MGREYREYIWPVTLVLPLGPVITLYGFYRRWPNRKFPKSTSPTGISLPPSSDHRAGHHWVHTGLPGQAGRDRGAGYYMHQGGGHVVHMTFTLEPMYYYRPSLRSTSPSIPTPWGYWHFGRRCFLYDDRHAPICVQPICPGGCKRWPLFSVPACLSPWWPVPTNFDDHEGKLEPHLQKMCCPSSWWGGILLCGLHPGSLQAFRFTNFVWHFTDFNVAHSLFTTMYGIISFCCSRSIYAILPKITGKEPKQLFVVSILDGLYWVVCLYDLNDGRGTLKGLSWIEGIILSSLWC